MTWFRHPKENLTYTGQWSEGKMHGEGLNTWPDGTSLKGTWFKGQRVGEHTIVSAQGDEVKVKYNNGKPKIIAKKT